MGQTVRKVMKLLTNYLLIFFVSMVPLIELRGAMVMAVGMDLNY